MRRPHKNADYLKYQPGVLPMIIHMSTQLI